MTCFHPAILGKAGILAISVQIRMFNVFIYMKCVRAVFDIAVNFKATLPASITQYCFYVGRRCSLSSGPYTQSIIRFFFLYIKLMCPYFILLIYTDGEKDGLWMACPFRTLVVLYRMFPFIICLILMNYLMEFYFIGFVNAHLPGCFCPWTFRLNIGLNTSPSDSFVSYLNSHLGYSAGEFQALQLIFLAVFGAVD